MRITKENILNEAWKSNLEILKNDLVDKVKNNGGETPLHALARGGVKEVLSHPSVDKVKNNKGYTPLHYLAWKNKITKKELKKRFPWYKKEIKNVYKAVEKIIDTPTSIQFILED